MDQLHLRLYLSHESQAIQVIKNISFLIRMTMQVRTLQFTWLEALKVSYWLVLKYQYIQKDVYYLGPCDDVNHPDVTKRKFYCPYSGYCIDYLMACKDEALYNCPFVDVVNPLEDNYEDMNGIEETACRGKAIHQ